MLKKDNVVSQRVGLSKKPAVCLEAFMFYLKKCCFIYVFIASTISHKTIYLIYV